MDIPKERGGNTYTIQRHVKEMDIPLSTKRRKRYTVDLREEADILCGKDGDGHIEESQEKEMDTSKNVYMEFSGGGHNGENQVKEMDILLEFRWRKDILECTERRNRTYRWYLAEIGHAGEKLSGNGRRLGKVTRNCVTLRNVT